jgi:hypothetical protein
MLSYVCVVFRNEDGDLKIWPCESFDEAYLRSYHCQLAGFPTVVMTGTGAYIRSQKERLMGVLGIQTQVFK